MNTDKELAKTIYAIDDITASIYNDHHYEPQYPVKNITRAIDRMDFCPVILDGVCKNYNFDLREGATYHYIPTFDDILTGPKMDTFWEGRVTDSYIQGLLDYLDIMDIYYARRGNSSADINAVNSLYNACEKNLKQEYVSSLDLTAEQFTSNDMIAIAAKRENNSYYLFIIESNRANCAVLRLSVAEFDYNDGEFIRNIYTTLENILKDDCFCDGYVIRTMPPVKSVKLI